jgi:hypothetical protein
VTALVIRIYEQVLEAKIKTARAVNASGKKKAEAIGMENKELEVNDVCTLRLEGTIKSTFRHLPVLVAEVVNKEKSTNAADAIDAASTVVNVAAATTAAAQCLIILESSGTIHLHNRHFWQCIV